MLPKFLYELLPAIYLISGVLSFSYLQHQAGSMAGVVLILAAALVAYWRFNYRLSS